MNAKAFFNNVRASVNNHLSAAEPPIQLKESDHFHAGVTKLENTITGMLAIKDLNPEQAAQLQRNLDILYQPDIAEHRDLKAAGDKVMFKASEAGSTAFFETLLASETFQQNKEDPSNIRNLNSSLRIALKNNNRELAEIISQGGASIKGPYRNNAGLDSVAILNELTKNKHWESAEILLSQEESNVFLKAMENGSEGTVKFMIDKGHNDDPRGEAMVRAAGFLNLPVLKYLQTEGGDLNQPDALGRTPWSAAFNVYESECDPHTRENAKKILSYLESKGAAPENPELDAHDPDPTAYPESWEFGPA